MKLSVIIPLYNKEKQIKNTLDSILNQGFADYEILIVNDGSTDHSVDIIKDIDDNRIHIISQQNLGVSTARNRGIAEAKGEYVFLLDADDSLMPEAFTVFERSEKTDIIIASFIQTDGKGHEKRRSINRIQGLVANSYKAYCNHKITFRMGNMFIRKSILDEVGGLRTDMTLYEDLEWNLRLLDKASVYSNTKVILNYNRGEEGLSHGFKPIEKDFAKIATIRHIDNKYKRRILGDFVFRRLISRLRVKDWHGVIIIWKNNSWRLMYCTFAFLSRLLRSNNRLINYIKVKKL